MSFNVYNFDEKREVLIEIPWFKRVFLVITQVDRKNVGFFID